MKVLIINSGPKPLPAVNGGGVETLIQNIIDNDKNNELTIVSYFDEKALEESKLYKDVRFIYINFNSIVFIFLRLIYYFSNHILHHDVGNALTSILRYKIDYSQFDVIICENGVRLGRNIRKLYNGRLILHLHNDWLNKYTIEAEKYKNSYDEIWVISNFLKKRVEEISGEAKVKILYNGVDNSLFSPINPIKRSTFRAQYNIDKDDLVLAYCGRIVPEKGCIQLIKAFKRITTKFTNCKLLIIGGFSESDSYAKLLLSESDTNIIFTGYVNHGDLPQIMGIADIGIAPTIHFDNCYEGTEYLGVIECFNLTIIEFLSLGIPVIATNSGGMPEIVDGFMPWTSVSARDSEFEEAIVDLLCDIISNEKWKDLQIISKERAAFFSTEMYIKSYLNYLSDI